MERAIPIGVTMQIIPHAYLTQRNPGTRESPTQRPYWGWQLALVLLSGAVGIAAMLTMASYLQFTLVRQQLTPTTVLYTLTFGAYILAMTIYTLCKTRLLLDLSRASWRVKAMAYISMIIGGAVGALILVSILLVITIVVIVFGGFILFLIKAQKRV